MPRKKKRKPKELTLGYASKKLGLKLDEIVEVLKRKQFHQVEPREDFRIDEYQYKLLSNYRSRKRRKAKVETRSTKKAIAKNKLRRWFKGKNRITVREIAIKTGCDLSALMVNINRNQNFPYSENAGVEYKRFEACIDFLTEAFFNKPDRIPQGSKKSKKGKSQPLMETKEEISEGLNEEDLPENFPMLKEHDELSFEDRPVGTGHPGSGKKR